LYSHKLTPCYADDGDGTLDNREFIILTVVRIGAAPPSLISQINIRFEELDRRREGKIKYEDIVYGLRKKKVHLRFKTVLSKEKLQQMNRMRNYASINGGQGEGAGSRVHPVDALTFTGMCEDDSNIQNVKYVSNDESRKDESAGDGSLGSVEGGRVLAAEFDTEPEEKFEGEGAERHHKQVDSDANSELSTRAFLSAVAVADAAVKAVDDVKDFAECGDLEEGVGMDNAACANVDGAAGEACSALVDRKEDKCSFHNASFDQQESLVSRALTPKTPSSVSFRMFTMAAAVDAMKISAAVQESENSTRAGGGDILLQRCSSNMSSSSRRVRRIENLGLNNEDPNNNNDLLASQKSGREIVKESEFGCCNRATGHPAVLWTRASPYLKDPYLQALLAWVMWLLSGTLFFKFHTHVGWCRALFQSVSIGYGIFWIPIDPGPFSHAYIRLHFVIGVAAIGGIMAVFARSLADSKARW
jgi:hypothetical protein